MENIPKRKAGYRKPAAECNLNLHIFHFKNTSKVIYGNKIYQIEKMYLKGNRHATHCTRRASLLY